MDISAKRYLVSLHKNVPIVRKSFPGHQSTPCIFSITMLHECSCNSRVKVSIAFFCQSKGKQYHIASIFIKDIFSLGIEPLEPIAFQKTRIFFFKIRQIISNMHKKSIEIFPRIDRQNQVCPNNVKMQCCHDMIIRKKQNTGIFFDFFAKRLLFLSFLLFFHDS